MQSSNRQNYTNEVNKTITKNQNRDKWYFDDCYSIIFIHQTCRTHRNHRKTNKQFPIALNIKYLFVQLPGIVARTVFLTLKRRRNSAFFRSEKKQCVTYLVANSSSNKKKYRIVFYILQWRDDFQNEFHPVIENEILFLSVFSRISHFFSLPPRIKWTKVDNWLESNQIPCILHDQLKRVALLLMEHFRLIDVNSTNMSAILSVTRKNTVLVWWFMGMHMLNVVQSMSRKISDLSIVMANQYFFCVSLGNSLARK